MGAAFPGFLVPLRFNYNAKFQHYLDIYNAVATGGQCEILGKPGMDNTALKNVANCIADACMYQLDIWEVNVTRDRKKKVYIGLGERVPALKMKFQREYGSKYLKIH